jgi:hypothetical protein
MDPRVCLEDFKKNELPARSVYLFLRIENINFNPNSCVS